MHGPDGLRIACPICLDLSEDFFVFSRAKQYQFSGVSRNDDIDQKPIAFAPDVAFLVARPSALEGMISVAPGQRNVVTQRVYDHPEFPDAAALPFRLSFQVPIKLRCRFQLQRWKWIGSFGLRSCQP
jgi:hypothetical protein